METSFPGKFLTQRVTLYRSTTERKPPKWNVRPQIVEYLPAFRTAFPDYTADMHLQDADWCMKMAERCHTVWKEIYEDAAKRYKLSKRLVSGIGYGEFFPRERQDKLGELARMDTTLVEASFAHWRAAGRRRNTFNELRMKYRA